MIYLQRSSAQFPATVCPPDGSEENNSDRNPRFSARRNGAAPLGYGAGDHARILYLYEGG